MILVYGISDKLVLRFESHFDSGVLVWPRHRPLTTLLGVDYVVIATKFVGHDEQLRAERLFGRQRVRRCYGGETALRREVERLLAEVVRS